MTKFGNDDRKIHIWSDGDSSVGINGESATVTLDDFYIEDCEHKHKILCLLSSTFKDIFDDGRVHVAFDEDLSDE